MIKTLKKIFLVLLCISLVSFFVALNVLATSEEFGDLEDLEGESYEIEGEELTDEELAEFFANAEVIEGNGEIIEDETDAIVDDEGVDENNTEEISKTPTIATTENKVATKTTSDESQSQQKLAYTGVNTNYILIIASITILIYTGLKYKKYINIE